MAHDPSTSRPVSRLSRTNSQQQETTESRVSSPLDSTKDRTSPPGSLDLNEHSPLLSPQQSHREHGSEDGGTSRGLLDWNDGAEEESKSTFYLFILTLGIGG